MGITYRPNNPSVEPFDVSYSGATLLGKTLYRIDCIGCTAEKIGVEDYRVWYSASGDEAKSVAAILAVTDDDTIIAARPDWGFVGTDREFVKFIRGWQTFLETCGGYTQDKEAMR